MLKPEIKKAIMELKNKIQERFDPDAEIILFGSAARDESTGASDIDLLIIVSGELTNSIEESIFSDAYDIELGNGVVFGIVVYSREFWDSPLASAMPLYQNIAREGIRV